MKTYSTTTCLQHKNSTTMKHTVRQQGTKMSQTILLLLDQSVYVLMCLLCRWNYWIYIWTCKPRVSDTTEQVSKRKVKKQQN